MENEDPIPIDPYEHYGLVVYIARRIAASYELWQHYDDLIQEGFCGLVEASRRYDPTQGVAVTTFVSFRIVGAIYDYLSATGLVKVPKERQQELREVDRAREQLEQRLGRSPTHQELAEALGITPARLQGVEKARIQVASLDDAQPRDERSTPEEVANTKERRTRKALLLEAVDACIKQLPSPQRELFLLRKAQPPLTAERRGQILGITEAEAWQAERRAKGQLRACLEKKGWTAGAVTEVWQEDVGA